MIRPLFIAFRLLAAILLLGIALPSISADDEYLHPEKAFVMRAEMASPDTVRLRFIIAPGYYMYRERFEFTIDDAPVTPGTPRFPAGRLKFDPTFNKEMELYFSDMAIDLPLSAWPASAAAQEFALKVTGQGCAVKGLCYPPQDFIAMLSSSADGRSYVVNKQAAPGLLERLRNLNWSDTLSGGDDIGLAGVLSSTGLIEITLLFFGLGVLLALTPCVLPMVPILSVLLVGEQQQVSRWRGLTLAASYVAGMSVVYTALGIAAGLSGAGLAAWLQTPWVLGAFAVLLAVLALAMFDVFQFQMPASIQSLLMARNASILGGRVTAAALMGALSALIVGPCVAAPLAGALLYISQTGDVVLGGAALFSMAWGMGVPLLLMGASAGKLMPRTGAWMEGVKKLFGVLLLGTAWWMATPLMPSWTQILGWAVLAMLCAVLLRTFDPLPEDAGFGGALRKTFGMMLALLCAVWVIGVASGGRSLLQPLSHLASTAGASPALAAVAQPPGEATSVRQRLLTGAATDGLPKFQRVRSLREFEALAARSTRPVMLDFYADWCVSCKEMEAFTFPDPRVAQRMGQLLLLQADVTANNADDRELLKRFKLFGPPGIIFFAPGGSERRDVRVVGFQDANRFAATLDRVLK